MYLTLWRCRLWNLMIMELTLKFFNRLKCITLIIFVTNPFEDFARSIGILRRKPPSMIKLLGPSGYWLIKNHTRYNSFKLIRLFTYFLFLFYLISFSIDICSSFWNLSTTSHSEVFAKYAFREKRLWKNCENNNMPAHRIEVCRADWI